MTTDLSTHFEVDLDPEPAPTHAPIYVDVVSKQDERRPIIPAQWMPQNLPRTVRYHAGRNAHRATYHLLRSPKYLFWTVVWGVWGVFRLVGRQIHWWWLLEQHPIRQNAATQNDAFTWGKLHKEAKATRLFRGWVLVAELLALVIAYDLLRYVAPAWVDALVAAVAVPLLAHYGRPATQPIISPAVVTPRFRKLTADVVLRAYYAAGLGHPEKPDQQVGFGSVMARDGDGSRVVVNLPYGKGFQDAVNAKPAIASGLDVAVSQVYLTRDPSSNRSHILWVADRDPLAIPAGKTPLLDCKPRDIWRPAPFGLDERGRNVDLLLLWVSILIGAQPRKGKTFTARLLALYAALDPYVRLTVVDGKMSPDWDKFRLVAHRYVCGTVPNSRDDDPITHLLEALREIKKHIEQVNDALAKLPTSECPEGKLTRELSRKYPHLRVWMLVMEEFQVYFETDSQEVNKEIAGLLSFIMAVGPSAGVIILSSSQKPSGVGAGDVSRLFNRYRDNHAVRFALKCGNRVVSEAILGGEAYSEGFDASALPNGPQYKGVGILYGAGDETPIVRTHLADHADAEKILTAARRHRDAAGTLTGMAAGEDMARQTRDVLADVRNVFYAGEAWISWAQIAARLAEQFPETYADITPEAISAQCRGLYVESKDGRDKYAGNRVVKGAAVASVEAAMKRRTLDSGR